MARQRRRRAKLCECGCGNPAPIATMTNRKYGHVKGQPIRFVHGHHLRKPTPHLSSTQLAWLAGLLEGEGSFIANSRMRKPKTGKSWWQVTPRVQVGMVDEDVIARVASLLGRSYWSDPRGRNQTMYLTQITGPNARKLMLLLYDHLGTRRQGQIDTVLAKVDQARAEQPIWPRKLGVRV